MNAFSDSKIELPSAFPVGVPLQLDSNNAMRA
jgi:hypothetical protein